LILIGSLGGDVKIIKPQIRRLDPTETDPRELTRVPGLHVRKWPPCLLGGSPSEGLP
jgi:hypothetical protein